MMATSENKSDFGEHATKGGNKRDFGEHATEGGNKRNFGEHATKSGHKRGFGWKQPFLLPIGALCVHSVCALCHCVCTMYARCMHDVRSTSS